VPLYHWTTTADGCLLVDQADGAGLRLPTLDKSAQLADKVAAEWGPLAMQHGQMHGVPVSWILAVILRESGGDAAARGKDGEIGLMQIIPSSHGMTAAELVAPADNIHKGAQLLGDSRRLGFDLPQAISRYNGGAEPSGEPHPSSLSPWGVRETRGHIAAVVAAHNFYLGQLCRGGVPAAARLGPLLAFAAALGWTVVRSP
jgi:soluble lytic murein transglycosylase-like protein